MKYSCHAQSLHSHLRLSCDAAGFSKKTLLRHIDIHSGHTPIAVRDKKKKKNSSHCLIFNSSIFQQIKHWPRYRNHITEYMSISWWALHPDHLSLQRPLKLKFSPADRQSDQVPILGSPIWKFMEIPTCHKRYNSISNLLVLYLEIHRNIKQKQKKTNRRLPIEFNMNSWNPLQFIQFSSPSSCFVTCCCLPKLLVAPKAATRLRSHHPRLSESHKIPVPPNV